MGDGGGETGAALATFSRIVQYAGRQAPVAEAKGTRPVDTSVEAKGEHILFAGKRYAPPFDPPPAMRRYCLTTLGVLHTVCMIILRREIRVRLTLASIRHDHQQILGTRRHCSSGRRVKESCLSLDTGAQT